VDDSWVEEMRKKEEEKVWSKRENELKQREDRKVCY